MRYGQKAHVRSKKSNDGASGAKTEHRGRAPGKVKPAHARRAQRRIRASERSVLRAGRDAGAQLALLEGRPGSSARERARLSDVAGDLDKIDAILDA